ncbi:MAG: dihydrolipoyl dehydrogenase [Bacteroidetes bacterium]|nr:dihydrolipoyl dehydrogenase [Rhodothermia bacterium]MCS7154907.1 dihydrolipoyl dehydrogenase [Bacteroidota bacterium]MCX7906934.1 dihydrolipoyl dehydrogenase [Bacteroidota bacterium]MDW8137702.1 dihydrolipoyl dehydrogenase [Bacteroidota bacterium]MDW8285344.1 dihydrolipoyl dehydrogenase [Bacteroidota bacterium]
MAQNFDLVVIGAGPGGYVAAIRAAQLGMRVAVVEKNKLGGVCLNVGCIPTKALLKSAEIAYTVRHAQEYGLRVEGPVQVDFQAVIARSRQVAERMSRGVQFLMKKNKIEVFSAAARLDGKGRVALLRDGKPFEELRAPHIVLATGARPRELPFMRIDHRKIWDSTDALSASQRPDSMLIVGAGAIGVEFAYFYHMMGTRVTLVEIMPTILPAEDEDIGRELGKSYQKYGIEILTESSVTAVDTSGPKVKATLRTPQGERTLEVDVVLSAVGVTGNIENLGLEELGVRVDKGAVVVDEWYRTNVEGIYAIGDVAGPPWLAHVASHEGILCVEKIAGLEVEPLDYDNIPGCTYCQPQVASVGLTEKAARERGYDIRVGKFPFQASGKAAAIGHTEGFVKVIFDARYGEWLGCHILGWDATELISEAVLARKAEGTIHEVMRAVHPHPTLAEAIMEAAAAAAGEAIHL